MSAVLLQQPGGQLPRRELFGGGASTLAAPDAAAGAGDAEELAWGAHALLLRQLSSSTAGPSGGPQDVQPGPYAVARAGTQAFASHAFASLPQHSTALVPGGARMGQAPAAGGAASNIVFDATLADAHQFYRAGDYINALSKCNEARSRPLASLYPERSAGLGGTGGECACKLRGAHAWPERCRTRRSTRSTRTAQTCCC